MQATTYISMHSVFHVQHGFFCSTSVYFPFYEAAQMFYPNNIFAHSKITIIIIHLFIVTLIVINNWLWVHIVHSDLSNSIKKRV